MVSRGVPQVLVTHTKYQFHRSLVSHISIVKVLPSKFQNEEIGLTLNLMFVNSLEHRTFITYQPRRVAMLLRTLCNHWTYLPKSDSGIWLGFLYSLLLTTNNRWSNLNWYTDFIKWQASTWWPSPRPSQWLQPLSYANQLDLNREVPSGLELITHLS